MIEWKDVTLKHVIESANTGLDAIKRAPIVLENTGIKCLRIQDISQSKPYREWGFTNVEQKNYEKFRLRKGDIIIARTGNTIGVNRFFNEDQASVFNNGLIRLRVKKDNVSPKYIFYNLRSKYFKDFIESISGGTSTQPNMQIEVLLTLDLLLPPLPEQERIAEVLSSLDDKIDLLQRQNKTLEEMAETLFRQWFVEKAEDSWEEKMLGELIEIKGGFTYKGEFIGNGEALLLGMGCVSNNSRFLMSGARPYSGECPEKYIVKPGDIVIATRQQSDNLPILGFPAIVPNEFQDKKVIVGANLYRVINNSEISDYLIYQLLRTIEYRNHIIASAKGSTVRMITKDSIESYSIILPSKKVLNKLEKVLSPINKKAITISKQINTLTHIRDTLLPKLMSGLVTVNEIA